ncbi:MAG: tetratricopeptide repeat protein [Bacteroidetes bacterium]|nr:tetratricopeptide repeat protein [Bacteroidota bacterium]
MFKKVSLFLGIAFLAFQSNAQKANIQSAINYLKDNNVADARKTIDEATTNESTKNNAKAWLIKAVVYQAIGTPKEVMPQLTFILNENPYLIDLSKANELQGVAPNAMNESIEAYKKAMSLDAKYSKEELLPLISTILGIQFNEGITKMNDNKFAEAYTAFETVNSLQKLDNGNLWKGNAALDTVFATGKMYQANSAYNSNKDDEAAALLEESIKNPITQDANLYIMLTDLYSKKNDDAKWSETMKAARTKFPKDARILNNEINYYIEKGRVEESIVKLKEGIAADPKKADLYLLLGQTYLALANPVDKNDKPLPKPANADEQAKNAETNYLKAAELDPKNPYAQFNLGLISYNQAKDMTEEMNKTNDNKVYDALKPKRDVLLDKAMPYFTKAKELIEADGASIKEEYKPMYKLVLTGMMNCYNTNNKTEKAAEMQKLINGVK